MKKVRIGRKETVMIEELVFSKKENRNTEKFLDDESYTVF